MVPDQGSAVGAQDASDLGQARRWVVPVMHRQRAHDKVERSIGKRQRGHVADEEPRTVAVIRPYPLGIGASALDHRLIDVQTSDLEAALAGEPDGQVTGSATHVEHTATDGGDGRHVGSDRPEQRAEQEPMAERVVRTRIGYDDSARHAAIQGGAASVPHSRDGYRSRGRRRGQNGDRSHRIHSASPDLLSQ